MGSNLIPEAAPETILREDLLVCRAEVLPRRAGPSLVHLSPVGLSGRGAAPPGGP